MESLEQTATQPPASSPSPRSRPILKWAALAALVLLGLAGTFVYRKFVVKSPRILLREAHRALGAREYERAEQLAARVPEGALESADALLIAGEAATKQDEFERAIAYYEKVPAGHGEQTVTARYCTGDLFLQLGEASRAEEQYRQALALSPDDLFSLEHLAMVLCNFGRRWEAVPYLFTRTQMQRASVTELLLLGDPDSVLDLPPNLGKYEERAPDDPLPNLALARSALDLNDLPEARRQAARVVDKAPQIAEGWALLGRALAAQGDDAAAFLDWHARVPREAETHPGIWLARGLWAEQHVQPRTAIRCYWEVLRRFPDSRVASYHLGQSLVGLVPPEVKTAAPFQARAEKLERLRNVLAMIYRIPTDRERMEEAAQITEALGRYWEAAAWWRAALERGAEQGDAARHLQRIVPRLARDLPRLAQASNPVLTADLSGYPLPDWPLSDSALPDRPGTFEQKRDAAPQTTVAANVRFEDSAAAVGINFQYFNGSEPADSGKFIHQTLGGGVAVIDCDGDSRPDLYLAQGAPAPNDFEEHSFSDRLFRNRGDGRFDDVTVPAGLGDRRYTLGPTAGDFNNDGFPDLYLANAGTNRLYRNNGDGTFADVSAEAGISGRHCCASCLIADLNGDALPDLFDVNYLAEPDVYKLTCQKDGVLHSCDPRLFEAEPDRLLLSRGDGRLTDVSDECGILVPRGKGLGVIAADFSGSGLLSLFVANDGTGNFYFINETPTRGASPRLRSAAREAGVAYSEDGKVQASMGVAADDADGDGLIDLCVTNFLHESVAFYHQLAPNLFQDAKRQFGLAGPTREVLGFGTQFLDADLDGWPDLLMTNGHIENYTEDGQPYRMPPQCFRNIEGQRFKELPAGTLGPFFQGEYLGRALARLDWNGDGLEDVAISHLDTPVALLTNTTRDAGHFMALRLVGTDSARDAIGAIVTFTVGSRKRTRQLTAGDGYLASNERQLVVGLGPAEQVDEVTIRWPSGREETHRQIPADGRWLAIEGAPRLSRLP